MGYGFGCCYFSFILILFVILKCIGFQERPNRKVRLSGYGVELQMKSTEYKAQDDTKVESQGGDGTQDDDDEEEVEGFNINKLK